MHKHTLAFIIIGSITSFFIGTQFASKTKTSPEENYSSTLTKKAELLTAELNKLQNQLIDLKRLPTPTQPSKVSANQEPLQRKDSNKELKLERLRQHAQATLKEVEIIKNNYLKNPSYDLNKAKKLAFESEPVEPIWASLREKKLQEALAGRSPLNNGAIKAIECHSKHCRIQVFCQSQDDSDNLSAEIRDKIKDKYDDLLIPFGSTSYSAEEKIATIYLTDDPNAILL